jgi:5'-nucleotidase/UDP-sugar diphosphatase
MLRFFPALLALPLLAADFTTTILHVNDTHDRIEPTIIQGKPYGGMARLGTLVERHRKSDPNPLFLHAGDAFQGTMYFNVYEGLADLAFLNALRPDAMAVGNHEFDKGPAALGTFARHAQFPLLSSNLDVSSEPALNGLFRRSTIVTRGRERIGIVGAITSDLPTISSPGPNVRMLDLRTSIQAEVDALTRAGVNKIVLLTHVGYDAEKELARTLRDVDVIVGGHSHALLGTTTAVGWPNSWGPYPTLVDNPEGGKTVVVQSWEGAKLMGRVQVTFDSRGRVKKWSTSQPVIVDESIPEDPTLMALVAAFEKPLAQQRDRKIAAAARAIASDGQMGGIIADAMLEATSKQGAVAALLNGGGVRAAFEPGDITWGMAISVQPFDNTLILMDVTGAQLRQALEDIVEAARNRVLWVSQGTRYALDPSKPAGSRVTGLEIAGKPVEAPAVYRIVVPSFLATGGDGVNTLKNSTGFRSDTGLLDIDAFTDYLAARSPVQPAEERVRRVR